MTPGCKRSVQLAIKRTAAALLLVLPAGSRGGQGDFAARLERLDGKTATVSDLSCDFIEKKYTMLLKEPLVSRGMLMVKGGKTRWETTSPYASTVFTDETRVAIHFPERNRVEIYPVDERLRSLIVSPIPRLAQLRRRFELSPARPGDGRMEAEIDSALYVRLVPRDPIVRDLLEEAVVAVDETLGLATRVELTDPDGDLTVIMFEKVRTNLGLSESDVTFIPPPGVKLVQPPEFNLSRAQPRTESE